MKIAGMTTGAGLRVKTRDTAHRKGSPTGTSGATIEAVTIEARTRRIITGIANARSVVVTKVKTNRAGRIAANPDAARRVVATNTMMIGVNQANGAEPATRAETTVDASEMKAHKVVVTPARTNGGIKAAIIAAKAGRVASPTTKTGTIAAVPKTRAVSSMDRADPIQETMRTRIIRTSEVVHGKMTTIDVNPIAARAPLIMAIRKVEIAVALRVNTTSAKIGDALRGMKSATRTMIPTAMRNIPRAAGK
jgi:hypothetical protein